MQEVEGRLNFRAENEEVPNPSRLSTPSAEKRDVWVAVMENWKRRKDIVKKFKLNFTFLFGGGKFEDVSCSGRDWKRDKLLDEDGIYSFGWCGEFICRGRDDHVNWRVRARSKALKDVWISCVEEGGEDLAQE